MSSKDEKSAKTAGKNITINQKTKDALKPIYMEYLHMKDALVSDNMVDAQNAGNNMQKALSKVDMSLFSGKSHDIWMKHHNNLKSELQPLANFKNIEEVRKAFQEISENMIALTKSFKNLDNPMYIQHCPMADDSKGANWLSQFKEIKNPYFGAKMLKCGETTAIIE